jgi:low temperature requirement protein LtrA
VPIRLPHQHEPNVSWFELFYDLVFVAATLEFGGQLAKHPTWTTAGWLAMCSGLLFTVWFLTVLLAEADSPRHRIAYPLVVIQMPAILVAALASNRSGGVKDWHGFLAMAVIFVIVAALFGLAPAADEMAARANRTIRNGFIVAALAAIFGGLTPKSWNPYTFVFVFVLVIGVALGPYLSMRVRIGAIRDEHLGERMGQLVLILLGESFLKVALAVAKGYGRPEYVLLGAAFFTVFSVWALYFNSAITGLVPHTITRLRIWLLGHLVIGVGALGLAVGITDLTVLEADSHISDETTLLVTIPLLLLLLGFAVVEFAVPAPQRSVPWVRVGGAAVVLAVGLVAAYGPVIGPDTYVVVMAGVSLAIAAADYLVTRPAEPPGLTPAG